jgi:hypothetical protein
MKKSLGISIFGAALLLVNYSSCDRFPSQGQWEMRKAALAVESQNLSALKEELAEKALRDFGTEEGIQTLKDKIQGHKMSIGESIPLDSSSLNTKNLPSICRYSITAQDRTFTFLPLLSLKIKAECVLGYAKVMAPIEKVGPRIACSRSREL